MVIDTSAIIAILFHEEERVEFLKMLGGHPVRRMSAATFVEIGVVLGRKRREDAEGPLERLLLGAKIQVEPVTASQARLAWDAFRTYGQGRHKAKLNFGDTFSYALAKSMGEPLLFKGNDFALTDITPAV